MSLRHCDNCNDIGNDSSHTESHYSTITLISITVMMISICFGVAMSHDCSLSLVQLASAEYLVLSAKS